MLIGFQAHLKVNGFLPYLFKCETQLYTVKQKRWVSLVSGECGVSGESSFSLIFRVSRNPTYDVPTSPVGDVSMRFKPFLHPRGVLCL